MHGRTAYRSLSRAPRDARARHPRDAGGRVRDDPGRGAGRGAQGLHRLFAGLGETGPDGAARERAGGARVCARRAPADRAQLHGAGRPLHRLRRPWPTSTFRRRRRLRLAERRHGRGVRHPGARLGLRVLAVRHARESGGRGHRRGPRGFVGPRGDPVVALYAGGSPRRPPSSPQAAARVVAGGRPVVLLAPGRSAAGARAARSHTGSLAPRRPSLDAVCRATGMRSASTRRGSCSSSTVALRSAPRPRGRRVAVITDGGGPGGIAADALSAAGLRVPELRRRSTAGSARRSRERGHQPPRFRPRHHRPRRLSRALPVVAGAGRGRRGARGGPAGLLGGALSRGSRPGARPRWRAPAAMAAVREAPACRWSSSTVYPDAAPAGGAAAARRPRVPRDRLRGRGARRAGARRRSSAHRSARLPPPAGRARGRPGLLGGSRGPGRGRPDDCGGPRAWPAPEEALAAAQAARLPGRLKALGLLHKSDAGGVALGLGDAAAAPRGRWPHLDRSPAPSGLRRREDGARDEGDRAHHRLPPRPAVAGPRGLVGYGGIYAELLGDTRTALAPLEAGGARTARASFARRALLTGARGRGALDVAAAAAAAARSEHGSRPRIRRSRRWRSIPLLVLPAGAPRPRRTHRPATRADDDGRDRSTRRRMIWQDMAGKRVLVTAAAAGIGATIAARFAEARRASVHLRCRRRGGRRLSGRRTPRIGGPSGRRRSAGRCRALRGRGRRAAWAGSTCS